MDGWKVEEKHKVEMKERKKDRFDERRVDYYSFSFLGILVLAERFIYDDSNTFVG